MQGRTAIRTLIDKDDTIMAIYKEMVDSKNENDDVWEGVAIALKVINRMKNVGQNFHREGEWVETTLQGEPAWKCSTCGFVLYDREITNISRFHFCPECSSHMKQKGAEDETVEEK